MIDAGRFKKMFLFGANPEVEEVILDQGWGPGLRVFDDNESQSVVDIAGTWEQGFKEVQNDKGNTTWVVCGVCSTPGRRAHAISKIVAGLEGAVWRWGEVTAGSAHIGRRVRRGVHTLVLDRAYVGPLAELQDHSVILPGGKIYHSAVLGTGSILVGGSTVLGRATVRPNCRVCANAVVLPNARIGPNATIGAGLTAAQLGPDHWDEDAKDA